MTGFRIGRAGAFAALALLAACASAPPPGAPPTPAPAPSPQPEPPVASTPPPSREQCLARDLAYLVGKPRSEIPVPLNPDGRRVTCTTCPMTMDYRPDRTNILFDADTGIIKEVKCG